jgi:hypothetical protein
MGNPASGILATGNGMTPVLDDADCYAVPPVVESSVSYTAIWKS